jgi:hypothetical protein
MAPVELSDIVTSVRVASEQVLAAAAELGLKLSQYREASGAQGLHHSTPALVFSRQA